MRKSKAIIDLVIIFYDTYFYQVYSELFADFYGFMSNPLKVKECNTLHTILVKTKLVSGQILGPFQGSFARNALLRSQ